MSVQDAWRARGKEIEWGRYPPDMPQGQSPSHRGREPSRRDRRSGRPLMPTGSVSLAFMGSRGRSVCPELPPPRRVGPDPCPRGGHCARPLWPSSPGQRPQLRAPSPCVGASQPRRRTWSHPGGGHHRLGRRLRDLLPPQLSSDPPGTREPGSQGEG